eukprot:4284711-Amphidinium_carterae.1
MLRSLGESPMPAAAERAFIDAERACARGLGRHCQRREFPWGSCLACRWMKHHWFQEGRASQSGAW